MISVAELIFLFLWGNFTLWSSHTLDRPSCIWGNISLQKVGRTIGQWMSVYILSIVLNTVLVTRDTRMKESFKSWGCLYLWYRYPQVHLADFKVSICSFILGKNNKHNMEFSERSLSAPSPVFSHLPSDPSKVIIVTFNTWFWDKSC